MTRKLGTYKQQVCRSSGWLANIRPLTCASWSLLTHLASDPSHRSGQFLKLRTEDGTGSSVNGLRIPAAHE
jgi:hypothetical protein